MSPAPCLPLLVSAARRIAVRIGSVALAGGLLVAALWGVDLAAAWAALQTADYRWLPPLGAVLLLAHLLRTWRWTIWLDALDVEASGADNDADAPDAGARRRRPDAADASDAAAPVAFADAFVALMTGYVVNYAAPRAGEVARTVHLAARTPLRAGQVFGTVVTERIVDVASLALALLSALALLLPRAATLRARFLAPVAARLEGLTDGGGAWLAALAVALGLAAAAWAVRRAVRREGSAWRRLWRQRVLPALADLRDGLATLWTAPRRTAVVGATLGMWACYALMAYLPLVMLGLAGAHDLSLADAWTVMALGALGILVPAPGGIGAFHYVTILTLTALFDVPEADAASYAVLGHAAQMAFHLVVGGAGLLWQGARVPLAASLEEAPVKDEGQTSKVE